MWKRADEYQAKRAWLLIILSIVGLVIFIAFFLFFFLYLGWW
jgi:hypothetical protein